MKQKTVLFAALVVVIGIMLNDGVLLIGAETGLFSLLDVQYKYGELPYLLGLALYGLLYAWLFWGGLRFSTFKQGQALAYHTIAWLAILFAVLAFLISAMMNVGLFFSGGDYGLPLGFYVVVNLFHNLVLPILLMGLLFSGLKRRTKDQPAAAVPSVPTSDYLLFLVGCVGLAMFVLLSEAEPFLRRIPSYLAFDRALGVDDWLNDGQLLSLTVALAASMSMCAYGGLKQFGRINSVSVLALRHSFAFVGAVLACWSALLYVFFYVAEKQFYVVLDNVYANVSFGRFFILLALFACVAMWWVTYILATRFWPNRA